jgi:hypothetical protein
MTYRRSETGVMCVIFVKNFKGLVKTLTKITDVDYIIRSAFAKIYTSCQSDEGTPRCFSALRNSLLFIMCFGMPNRDGSGIKGLHVKSLTGLLHKK